MSLLSVQNVTFGYTVSKRVLDGVSLTIEPGDSIGPVGESGSGKTTLLRLLLGLTRPSSGIITFKGTPLDPRSACFMRDYRRQCRWSFRTPIPRSIRARPCSPSSPSPCALAIAGDHRQMVSDAPASVGLERNILTRYPHEFSGGQRQLHRHRPRHSRRPQPALGRRSRQRLISPPASASSICSKASASR
ncbi:ATP-binding cassette domain-containing protein [Devosia sp. A8/3-2]|nr:ATP-binding cassette domain-containing protein [Devosia sp. A8/3-2]